MMREDDNSNKNRRQFSRYSPRVYYRVGKSQSLRQRVSDISIGGVRIYSDTRWDIGEEVALELFFPDGDSGEVKARVVWIKELAPDTGASYDVGLEFVDLPLAVTEWLREALEIE